MKEKHKHKKKNMRGGKGNLKRGAEEISESAFKANLKGLCAIRRSGDVDDNMMMEQSERKKSRVASDDNKANEDQKDDGYLINMQEQLRTPKPIGFKQKIKCEPLTVTRQQIGGWIPGFERAKSVMSRRSVRRLVEEKISSMQILFWMQSLELSFIVVIEKLSDASKSRNSKARRLLCLATVQLQDLQDEVYLLKSQVAQLKRNSTLNFICKSLNHTFAQYSIFKEKFDLCLTLCADTFTGSLQMVPLVGCAKNLDIKSFSTCMSSGYDLLNRISRNLNLNQNQNDTECSRNHRGYYCGELAGASEATVELENILKEELNILNHIDALLLALRLKKLELDSLSIQQIQMDRSGI